MKNTISEQEHVRLKKELSKATKEIKNLSGKLEKSKEKIDSLRKELKKNDVPKNSWKKGR